MTYTPTRAEVLEAIQGKRRGGWSPESIPGRNGNEEGERALAQIERNAVAEFLQSDEAVERFAEAIAQQRLPIRGVNAEHLSDEDVFFCKIKAEAVLATLTEVIA